MPGKKLDGLTPAINTNPRPNRLQRTTDIELPKGAPLIDPAGIEAINTPKYGGFLAQVFGSLTPDQRVKLSENIRALQLLGLTSKIGMK